MKIARTQVADIYSRNARRLLHPTDFDSIEYASYVIRTLTGDSSSTDSYLTDIESAVARHKERKLALFAARHSDPKYEKGRILRQAESRVERLLTPTILDLYRTSYTGSTRVSVEFSDGHYAVGRASHLTVAVSPYWRSEIGSVEGLAEAGDMLTTHANSVAADAWEAAWVRQGRGFALHVERGFIARFEEGTFAHGKSLAGARRAARRRTLS